MAVSNSILEQWASEYDKKHAAAPSAAVNAYRFDATPESAPYLDAIRTAEKKYGIPENLLARMIQQESNFNPTAVSKKGARGLAQIVPKWHPDAEPDDPFKAIDYSAKYLRENADRFGKDGKQDWRLGLAGYNAGPGAVAEYGDVPPFKETQDYVKRIHDDGIQQPLPKPAPAGVSGSILADWAKEYDRNQGSAQPRQQGFVKSVIGDVAGGMIDLVEMYGQTGRVIPGGDRPGRDDGGLSSKVIGWANRIRQENPSLDNDPGREGLSRWFHQGLRSAVTSLASGAPGAAAGAALGSLFGPVGAFAGGVLGFATGGATIFGLAEYDSVLEDALKAGVKPEIAEPAALRSGLYEAGFEFAGNILEGLTIGSGKLLTVPLRTVRTAAGKEVLKEGLASLFKANGRQMLKRMAGVAAIETGSEVITGALQTEEMRRMGLTDQTMLDGAIEAFGPSLVASMIFGGLGEYGRSRVTRNIKNILADPQADPQARAQAANMVAEAIKPASEQLATAWQGAALKAIENGEAIDLDAPVKTDRELDARIENDEQLAEKTVQAVADELNQPVEPDVKKWEESQATTPLGDDETAKDILTKTAYGTDINATVPRGEGAEEMQAAMAEQEAPAEPVVDSETAPDEPQAKTEPAKAKAESKAMVDAINAYMEPIVARARETNDNEAIADIRNLGKLSTYVWQGQGLDTDFAKEVLAQHPDLAARLNPAKPAKTAPEPAKPAADQAAEFEYYGGSKTGTKVSRQDVANMQVVGSSRLLSEQETDKLSRFIKAHPEALEKMPTWGALIKLKDKSELNFVFRELKTGGYALSLEGHREPGDYGLGTIASTMTKAKTLKTIRQAYKDYGWKPGKAKPKAAPEPAKPAADRILDKEVNRAAKADLEKAPSTIRDDIVSAARGVFTGSQTDVDRLFNEDHEGPGSGTEIYAAFDKTRQTLRKKHGDFIKLYRLQGDQNLIDNKHTLNWVYSEKMLSEFKKMLEKQNRAIVERDVPTDDIVAVNVGKGRYEEFIVLNHDSKGLTYPAGHPKAKATIKGYKQPAAPRGAIEYQSGVDRPAAIKGMRKAGQTHLAANVQGLSNNALSQLLDHAKEGGHLLLDNGAFPAFKKGAALTDKQISHAFKRFYLAAKEAKDPGTVTVIAPDVVGDQDATIRLAMTHWKETKGLVKMGANVILPVQKGETFSPAEMWADMVNALGDVDTGKLIAGIPSNEEPFTTGDIVKLFEKQDMFPGIAPPTRVHLLGMGKHNSRFKAVSAAIPEGVEITADATGLRTPKNVKKIKEETGPLQEDKAAGKVVDDETEDDVIPEWIMPRIMQWGTQELGMEDDTEVLNGLDGYKWDGEVVESAIKFFKLEVEQADELRGAEDSLRTFQKILVKEIGFDNAGELLTKDERGKIRAKAVSKVMKTEPQEYKWLREDGTVKIDPKDMTDDQYAVARSMRGFSDHEKRAKDMQSRGPLDDMTVKAWAAQEFGIQGGMSDDRLMTVDHWGGNNPRVTYGYSPNQKKVSGKKLIQAVRDVFGIEAPAKTTKDEPAAAAPLPTSTKGPNYYVDAKRDAVVHVGAGPRGNYSLYRSKNVRKQGTRIKVKQFSTDATTWFDTREQAEAALEAFAEKNKYPLGGSAQHWPKQAMKKGAALEHLKTGFAAKAEPKKGGFVKTDKYHQDRIQAVKDGITGTEKALAEHEKAGNQRAIDAHKGQIASYQQSLVKAEAEYAQFKGQEKAKPAAPAAPTFDAYLAEVAQQKASGITITEQAKVTETDQTITRERDVSQALSEVDAKIDTYTQLLDCIA